MSSSTKFQVNLTISLSVNAQKLINKSEARKHWESKRVQPNDNQACGAHNDFMQQILGQYDK